MRKIECADCGGVFDQKEMNTMTNTVICDGCLKRRQDFHRRTLSHPNQTEPT